MFVARCAREPSEILFAHHGIFFLLQLAQDYVNLIYALLDPLKPIFVLILLHEFGDRLLNVLLLLYLDGTQVFQHLHPATQSLLALYALFDLFY